MGEIRIPLESLADSGEAGIDKWFPLQKRYPDETTGGDIRILLSFTTVDKNLLKVRIGLEIGGEG